MGNEIDDLKKQIEELKAKIAASPTQVKPSQPNINTEEYTVYEWEAPVRVFNKWESQKITTLVLCVSILLIILLFLREYILLLSAILLTFLSVALAIVPPANTKHRITNKGIHSFEKLYIWDDLGEFWLAKKANHTILYINTKLTYPEKLFFVLPEKDIQSVIKSLSNHLKYFEKRDQNSFGKLSDGVYIPYNEVVKL